MNNFVSRHIGPQGKDVEMMLKTLGVSSIDELIEQTIPVSIRMKNKLNISEKGMSEYEYLNHIKEIASKNKIFRTYIGQGYYNTVTPSVILRNILENPGWYTSYTPYQAEVSQGRLEALLNFQTMIIELTGLPMANASLLDEGTAAAEAMIMMHNSRSRAQVKNEANQLFVSEDLFPQTVAVIKTRAIPLGIELVFGKHCKFDFSDKVFGAIVQYPNKNGEIHDYRTFTEKAHSNGSLVAVAADLMSLCLLTPPGEFGADIAVGTSQRFGIPMGFGGPHAGYFATRDEFKRNMPGRIIGITIDGQGNRAVRMALQTREQHIKREKATSNICTAQALLAIMAGFYGAYHGNKGLKSIASGIHKTALFISQELTKLGYVQNNKKYFDTLNITIPFNVNIDDIRNLAIKDKINFRYIDDKTIGISIDETTCINDVKSILCCFAKAAGKSCPNISSEDLNKTDEILSEELIRKSDFMTQSVFNSYHSETEMMRYMKRLENKDISLNFSMISLGSCTMKLNAASEMLAISWPEFGSIHPFAPSDQTGGYMEMIKDLENDLSAITGFAATTLQPNSGAAAEYTGLMVIRQYHISRNEGHRNVVLIPSSAHGTNPASAAMAGMNVVVVKCDENGNIDLIDLKEKAVMHRNNLSALMVTYPSTHGVFEEGILEIIKITHENGGQVYMDGANMNAQVGITNPGTIGADVCHLNLHKTFAIPHGGGGPGVGTICVAQHLVKFLPGHSVVTTGGEEGITAVSSAPFGSAMVLPISYGYIKMMGAEGLTMATKFAILNANYIAKILEDHYKILYTGKNGRVAHEMILDCNNFKRTADVEAIDIAKRLMDYGFHAPTVAFPVHGTLMVEPTESESLRELDRFCQAMIQIREEIKEIEDGISDKKNNLLKNSPHTSLMVTNDEWIYPYSRKKAAYPLDWIKDGKFWPSVNRVDDAYGDRNLVCICETVESHN